MSSDDTTGFSIHTLDSFVEAGSNVVAIGQQYASLDLYSSSKAIPLYLYRVLTTSGSAPVGAYVNDLSEFSLVGTLPPGLSFSSLGMIYGTPSGVSSDIGPFSVTITASIDGNPVATYPLTIYINPPYQSVEDFMHDVRVALDEILGVDITCPLPAPTLYDYNSTITASAEISSSNPHLTYLWDFGGLPTLDKSGTPINSDAGLATQKNPELTLINLTREDPANYDISITVTDNQGSFVTSPTITYQVHTPWFCTASSQYQITGTPTAYESQLAASNGTYATRIDQLGL